MSDRAGRPVTARIRVRGWLRTESPLHVGGLGDDPSEALPIAVDGLGRPYVPGTTLAGVLRHWMLGAATYLDDEERSGPVDEGLIEDMRGLWGYAPRRDAENKGQASRVVVADALIAVDTRLGDHGLPATPLDPARLEYRPSVGIDRTTGAAATEFLYGRAVIPAGHYIRLALDIECRGDGEADEARMAAMLTALAGGEIRIGAATGKGLGVVRLLEDTLELVVDRFDSPEGLLAALRGTPSGDRVRTLGTLRRANAALPPRRRRLDVRVAWRPLAPVMVRSGRRGLIVDMLPLTTRVDDRHLTLVLPGSSIKGALRSHAELVERTARGMEPAPTPVAGGPADWHSAAFRKQLDELPAVRRLFGSARADGEPEEGGEPRRAGAIRVEECASLATIPEALWRSVTGADAETLPGDDGRLPEQVRDRLEDLGMTQADHVGLDRWTGGAADGRLFSVLEPHAVEWEPIHLSVDLTRLGDDGAALALLLLTLRDLAAGRVPLGASTNRGLGDIEVTEVTLTDRERWPEPVPLAEALRGPHVRDIADAWTRYVEAS